MQILRSTLSPHSRWWLLASLGVLVCVGGLFLLRACQAQPTSPERAAAPTPVATAVEAPTLTWNYTTAAPARFVVRRSIADGTWQDVAVLPGASGTGITWKDTTLPASEGVITVKYAVYAVGQHEVWSKASNIAATVVGEEPPIELGECVAVKRGKKKVIMTCTQK